MSRAKTVDFEEAILNWAEREYDRTATRNERKLKEKQRKTSTKYINIVMDWSKVRIIDETKWPTLKDLTVEASASAATSLLQETADDSKKPTMSVLFHTCFTNNTDDNQEYTMRTEKTTRSSLCTEVETGYTKGIEMAVKLTTPCQIFESNVGFKREFSLNKVEGDTFEEEITWGVESVIQVKPKHVAEAFLVINEKKLSGEFEIVSRMKGFIYVTYHNIKDNNSMIKATGHELGAIVKEHLDREKRKGRDFTGIVEVEDDGTVVTRTTGTCNFRYGVKQETIVSQKPL
ncbi:hypothetical protein HELRODRAFT_184932 [Helobdella robusta]|uniref:Uncharacterized protein n=1 Tax=Helobdella robusta TaxID=6412 RepID=T1FM64_HELRO|nr:hypothetical protein HELRODRAFT_184932 [Helobdella robusta]ESO06470.1 hypothetical protein HELRODRAFT_184932 [Helobdella robusta]